MSISIQGSNLVYFPVPKVACTSLKSFVYEVEFQKPFEPYVTNKKKIHIHNWREDYRSCSFFDATREGRAEGEFIAVIRDPIKRVLSAYQNRVTFHGELGADKVNLDIAKALGVQPNPLVNDFILHLEKYALLHPSIKHHIDPMTYFLGHDLSYFHHVIPIEETNRFRDLVNKACGTSVEMRREQGGGKKAHFSDLSRKAQVKLLEYCAGDYALLRDYYSPPKLT